jgi:hypothetical protein
LRKKSRQSRMAQQFPKCSALQDPGHEHIHVRDAASTLFDLADLRWVWWRAWFIQLRPRRVWRVRWISRGLYAVC